MAQYDLQKALIIITGGARGIGEIATAEFARQCAIVVVWDVDREHGEQLQEEMRQQNYAVEFMPVDVSDYVAVEAAARQVMQNYGHIDVLINNAGITRDATLLKMTPEQWQQVIDINLTGVFNCTRAVAPYMVEKGRGRIINTSSVVALYGNFGQTNYVAAKAGLIGMTRVWARELGRKGITVNAVAPGFIETEMVLAVPEKVLQAMREKTPLGRLGKPEEVVNVYLFLASEESAYINGAVISVDGGLVT